MESDKKLDNYEFGPFESIGEKQNVKGKNSELDSLLSKYSIIWVWSIIVGLNSAVSYTFYTFRVGNFAFMSLIVIGSLTLAFISSLFTWLALYRILRYLILPQLFENPTQNIEDPHSSEKRIKDHYYSNYVHSAFYYLILATTFKFIAFIIEQIVTSLKF